MCVQCNAAESSACRAAAPVCGVDDTCRSCATGSEGSTPGAIGSVVATPLTFGNDIAFGNASGTQVEAGNCAWRFSDIGPVPRVGTGDLNLDPQFVAPAQNNFHLQASSPLRDAADPTATVADDIDDDARRQGGGRDVGADEIN